MTQHFHKMRLNKLSLLALAAAATWWQTAATAQANGPYDRTISYQNKGDLFYNFHEGPEPSGTTANMYISPMPVPANVGHTYTTYQPLMPHEYLYKHTRSHYTYNQGAGWTRSKIRYRTYGLRLDHMLWKLNPHF